MQKFGIDISVWQKGFDFDKAKADGVEFAILRGAYHLSKDKCFEDFYATCKARNIPVGVYLYSKAKTIAAARQEAEYLISKVLIGKRFEYPIYMDVEADVQLALGKELLTEIIIEFCETLEVAGYYVGVYSTAAVFRDCTHENKLLPYDKWIAHWARKCSYTGDYGMWQFGGETNLLRNNKVAGKVCDQDYAYKDYPAIIRSAGLNGYGKFADVPETDVEAETPKADSVVKLDYAKKFTRTIAGKYKVNSAIGLKLRTGASTFKQIIETMSNGSTFTCYGYHTGSWYYGISSSGKEGFCHKSLLLRK